MSYPLEIYLENFTAPSEKVIFTWKDENGEEAKERRIEIDPKYMAAISTLYRSVPQCDTFEINQRKTILGASGAHCFLCLLPDIQGWEDTKRPLPLEDFLNIEDYIDWDVVNKWNIDDFYQATELCNFLGIQVSEDPVNSIVDLQSEIQEIVVFHQVCIQTDCKAGIQICEEMFRRKYSINPLLGFTWKRNCDLIPHWNENYRCIVQAYIDFAKIAYKVDRRTKAVLRQKLEWKNTVQKFGVKINLDGNTFL